MDDEMKKKIVTEAVVPALVPLARIGVNNYYTDRQMEKRQQHEIKMAAYQNEVLDGEKDVEPSEWFGENDDSWLDIAKPDGEDDENEARTPDETLDEALGVAEDLESQIQTARENEQCEFCRDVLRALENEPLPTQKQGLEELKEIRRVMYSDAGPEEIEQTMEKMEVAPRLYMKTTQEDATGGGAWG